MNVDEMSTDGREAIMWMREIGRAERGRSQMWLHRNVDSHRQELGLPSRHEERKVAVRASVKKFSEAMERLTESLAGWRVRS